MARAYARGSGPARIEVAVLAPPAVAAPKKNPKRFTVPLSGGVYGHSFEKTTMYGPCMPATGPARSLYDSLK